MNNKIAIKYIISSANIKFFPLELQGCWMKYFIQSKSKQHCFDYLPFQHLTYPFLKCRSRRKTEKKCTNLYVFEYLQCLLQSKTVQMGVVNDKDICFAVNIKRILCLLKEHSEHVCFSHDLDTCDVTCRTTRFQQSFHGT